MKKRSALTVAAGVVGALLSGIVGYTLRLTGGQAATAAQAPQKPVVKTITTTVHVKKKPKVRHIVAAPAHVSVVSTSTAPTHTSTGGSHAHGEGDDGNEHEGGDD